MATKTDSPDPIGHTPDALWHLIAPILGLKNNPAPSDARPRPTGSSSTPLSLCYAAAAIVHRSNPLHIFERTYSSLSS